jgi:hypothetical protein
LRSPLSASGGQKLRKGEGWRDCTRGSNQGRELHSELGRKKRKTDIEPVDTEGTKFGRWRRKKD